MTPELQDVPEVLVDKPQPVVTMIEVGTDLKGLGVEPRGRPGVGMVEPGQALDQSRLAGSVLADERMDLVLPHVEGCIDQSTGSAESLRKSLDPQEGLAHLGALSGQHGLRSAVSDPGMRCSPMFTNDLK